MKHSLAIGLALGMAIAFSVSYLIAKEYGFVADKDLQNQIEELENQKTNLETQLVNSQDQTITFQNDNSELQSEKTILQRQTMFLRNQIIDLQNENINLKNQLNNPKTPSLFTRLGVSDVLYSAHYAGSTNPGKSNRSRLFIQGEVWNAGDTPAKNCRLHVMLYQQGTATNGYPKTVVASDTYIELGTIDPWTCVQVSKDIFYTGEKLSGWSIIPQIGS